MQTRLVVLSKIRALSSPSFSLLTSNPLTFSKTIDEVVEVAGGEVAVKDDVKGMEILFDTGPTPVLPKMGHWDSTRVNPVRVFCEEGPDNGEVDSEVTGEGDGGDVDDVAVSL